MKKRLLILLLFFPVALLTAQDNLMYNLFRVNTNGRVILLDSLSLDYPADSNRIKALETERIKRWIAEGYLAAGIDSTSRASGKISSYAYRGHKYQWACIQSDQAAEEMARRASVRVNRLSGKPVDLEAWQGAMEKILNYLEDHGYPFARVGLSDTQIDSNTISGTLFIDPGNALVFDSLVINDEARIRKSYLEHYLGIRPGKPYREERLERMSRHIRALSFLEEIRSPEVEFYGEGATVYSYLNNRKSNRFDGIIGFQPNQETSGKLVLTGMLNLDLLNSFGAGERLKFQWQRFESSSQELEASFNYPYVFNSSIGLSLGLELFKQDSSFLNLSPRAAMIYHFNGINQVSIHIRHTRSNILADDPSLQQNDFRSTRYGLGLMLQDLDYPFNPRRGYHLSLSAAAGEKKFSRQNLAENEEEEIRNTLIEGELFAEGYLPLWGRWTLHLQNRSAHRGSDELFDNELYRLGGIRTIRGFDENSIKASSYTLFSGEVRFLFERNSALYLFSDAGIYERKIEEDYLTESLFSFGLGTNISTRAGIFSINYALGKRGTNPIDLSRGKVHFGYVNRF